MCEFHPEARSSPEIGCWGCWYARETLADNIPTGEEARRLSRKVERETYPKVRRRVRMKFRENDLLMSPLAAKVMKNEINRVMAKCENSTVTNQQ